MGRRECGGTWTLVRARLARKQNGAAALQNGRMLSDQVQHFLIIQSSSCIPVRWPKRNENLYPHEDSSMDAYSSFICHRPKQETTQMSMGRGRVYPHPGTFPTVECHPAITRNNGWYPRWHRWTLRSSHRVKEARPNTVWFHFYDFWERQTNP